MASNSDPPPPKRRKGILHHLRDSLPQEGEEQQGEGQQCTDLPRGEQPSRGGARQHTLQAASSSSHGPEVPRQDEASSSVGADPEICRGHVARLFLRNKMSGLETNILCQRAQASGAIGVEDMNAAGSQGRNPKNMARDLLRTATKHCKWPPMYWARIPTCDPATGSGKAFTMMPFLLIHEMLAFIVELGTCTLEALSALAPDSGLYNTKNAFCAKNRHMDPKRTIPIGVHGDGVPHQSSRTIECVFLECGEPARCRAVLDHLH